MGKRKKEITKEKLDYVNYIDVYILDIRKVYKIYKYQKIKYTIDIIYRNK